MGQRIKAVLPAALFILLIINSGGREAAAGGERASPGSEDFQPDTVYYLPEVIVRADRPARPEQLSSRFVAFMDVRGMGAGSRDIPAVLAEAAGIRVKSYGGIGSYSAMSIRGSSSAQVQVYLDGVPLNDPYSGMANLSELSIGSIERIEIYRGSSPAAFGGSAIGGRVNLVSDPGINRSADPDIEAGTGFGSFGMRRHSISLSSGYGPVSLRLNGGYTESEGDFPFLDDNGTPAEAADDEISTRMNNDFARLNISGRASFDIPGIRAGSVNFDYFRREGGVCGIGSNQSNAARIERERGLGYLKLEPEPLLGSRLRTELTLFHSRTGERFSDPAGEISLGRQKTNNSITSSGGSFTGGLNCPKIPLSLELFIEGRSENYHPVEYLPVVKEGPDRKRRSITSVSAGNLSLADDRVVISGQYRALWSESEFYNDPPLPYLPPVARGKIESRTGNPQAGIRVRISKNITLKGNAGKYVRMPTFFELFGNIGTVSGNTGLEPERGENRDFGAVFNCGRVGFVRSLFLEGSYFDNGISNLILFFPNSQRTVKPKNIGAARIRGAEFTLSSRLFSFLNLSGNYTCMDAVDESDIPYYNGNQLASTPAHQAALKLTIRKGRWSAGYGLSYIGENFLDKANMMEVPERKLHSVSLAVRNVMDYFKFTLEGRNLADSQVSDVIGYPLPGRAFYFTTEFIRDGGKDEIEE